MEIFHLEKDITVFYVQAESYPEGIMAAHQQLHSKVPFSRARGYFGLSRPNEKGVIQYYACAEEMQSGEAVQYGCPCIILKAGNYNSVDLTNYRTQLSMIGETFQKLLHQPGIDPQGYCVEWYLNETDMRAMVRLA